MTADLTVIRQTVTDTIYKEAEAYKVIVCLKLSANGVPYLCKAQSRINVSSATTQTCIRYLGYSCHSPCVMPPLSQRQPQKCITWANEKMDSSKVHLQTFILVCLNFSD